MRSGDYYLSGVMEVASVIRFNPDQTFEFFFSYGAVDRCGKGAWEQHPLLKGVAFRYSRGE